MRSVELTPRERLIFALDVESLGAAEELVATLHEWVGMFKVGHQLYSSAGPAAVEMVKARGAGCFLDLKYHDIPATVASAGVAAMRLGVDMFNLHIQGGEHMIRACLCACREEAARAKRPAPNILGVTILTSLNDEALHQLGYDRSVRDQVLRLARLAREAGLDGVIASPQEAREIKDACGQDFLVVTPGVRPSWGSAENHRRLSTPAGARNRGADYIVVGRPIRDAADPADAARLIWRELAEAEGYPPGMSDAD